MGKEGYRRGQSSLIIIFGGIDVCKVLIIEKDRCRRKGWCEGSIFTKCLPGNARLSLTLLITVVKPESKRKSSVIL